MPENLLRELVIEIKTELATIKETLPNEAEIG